MKKDNTTHRKAKRYEMADLSGNGAQRHAVYDMPIVNHDDYWANVTDVPCPICESGTIRWAEAGYVPGSRFCDGCGRFFQAHGSIQTGVTLMRDSRFDKSILSVMGFDAEKKRGSA